MLEYKFDTQLLIEGEALRRTLSTIILCNIPGDCLWWWG